MPHPDRRALLQGIAAIGLATSAAASAEPPPPTGAAALLGCHGQGRIPWFTRLFHLYNGPSGKTEIALLPANAPMIGEAAQLLRRHAERVTAAGLAPHAGFDFHVANQPTLLIPIFGSMLIGLEDGSLHELRHGDLAYAEDCAGKGHVSRAGAEGSFMVSVQLPKPLCPANGRTDPAQLWAD